MNSDDEQQILQLFEDGDRALISADVVELQRIYADDYAQYDESGKVSDRQDLIRNLTSGGLRFVSMKSTGRRIRLLRDDVAIVQGSEEDEVERNARREMVSYVYTDVVVKREGRWQIVASQLARPLVK
ncbi:MAG TPA: nuclear transport factor 2 family protein [Candidatus Dormibacteraeota bacterium]|nr:nuclear transport factor 2 family protein [Candidatus Dormibacteraeota bacterium]